jgi:dGTPase
MAERPPAPYPSPSAEAYGADLAPGERRPAAYSAGAVASRGRLHPEPACPTRSDFQRDRDRIIHSTAFRRLTFKTQMFVFHEGDYYRTRLTHTLEVAQIARTIARQLRLDEDLAEALALAHDLGHPPFGHAGERALDRAMADHGGFDHNVQSFRIVTRLERKYPGFDGLNLAWETLEGLVKHNGPPREAPPPGGPALLHALRHFEARMSLAPDRWGSAESQVAAIADDVAWHTHDIDDGLRAGLVAFDDLATVPLLAPLIERSARAADGDPALRIYGVVRQLITDLIADIVSESRRRLAVLAPAGPDDIRAAGGGVVGFSGGMAGRLAALRAFLFARLYRAERVGRVMADAERITTDLLARYADDPESLPGHWREAAEARPAGRRRMRLVADFVAGMTDRYAIAEHRRLFDATPDLR